MANYSFEKGKYGGPCGAIFPFFREIPGFVPVEQDYFDYIPAGYLKCRGQILQADQYPNLSRVLGVGANCIYRKAGTLLQEPDEDGSGGTFQIPDLGSKYISASSNSGQYSNNTSLNPTTNVSVQRAGVELSIESPSNELEFTYTGSFSHPGISSLSFSGRWRIVSPSGRTPSTQTFISDFLAHGHTAGVTIGPRINVRNDALGNVRYSGEGGGGLFNGAFGDCCGTKSSVLNCESNGNAGVAFVFNTLTESGDESSHFHLAPPPIIRESSVPFGSIPSTTQLGASSLTTTVKINKGNTFKDDNLSPRFIICEYLIKF
jgi:hypothetical protein